jgi:hypothetical protein
MTGDDFGKLIAHGLFSKTEFIAGRVVNAGFELVFSPEQAAAAAEVGVQVRTCVDVLVEHPELRAELAARLAAETAPSTAPPVDAAVLTEQHLREVAPGRRDARQIPPPPSGLAAQLDGPADLLARALWVYAQGSPAAITMAAWATAPDPKLHGLSPAQWADRRLDADTLLHIAWRDATLFAR